MCQSDPTPQNTKGFHYAWVVMIALGLVMSGTIGSFTILASLFYYPVAQEIGCELSQLTMYVTIEMVCMGLAMPVVGNLLKKVPLHYILGAAVAARSSLPPRCRPLRRYGCGTPPPWSLALAWALPRR